MRMISVGSLSGWLQSPVISGKTVLKRFQNISLAQSISARDSTKEPMTIVGQSLQT